MTRPLLDRDLIYVTGKGGVGKTTVAASIGLAAAAQGRTTIVCEVAEQHHMSRAFAHAGVGRDHEARLADDLYAITVDPQPFMRDLRAGTFSRLALPKRTILPSLIGFRPEYQQAREYLDKIGQVAPYVVIPGNHDIRWNPLGKEGQVLYLPVEGDGPK